jgi:hypothetical protein
MCFSNAAQSIIDACMRLAGGYGGYPPPHHQQSMYQNPHGYSTPG